MTKTLLYFGNSKDIISLINQYYANEYVYIYTKSSLLTHIDTIIDDIIYSMKENGYNVVLKQILYNAPFCIEFYNKNKDQIIYCHFNNTSVSYILYKMIKMNCIDTVIIDIKQDDLIDIEEIKQLCDSKCIKTIIK